MKQSILCTMWCQWQSIGNLVDVGGCWKLLLSLGLRLVVPSVTEHTGTRTMYSSFERSGDSLDVCSWGSDLFIKIHFNYSFSLVA